MAEVIGGVETTTPSKINNKPTQPLGDPDMQITPLRIPVDNIGSLAGKHTTVEAQRVARAPGRSTVHHQETDHGQTSLEETCSIPIKRDKLTE